MHGVEGLGLHPDCVVFFYVSDSGLGFLTCEMGTILVPARRAEPREAQGRCNGLRPVSPRFTKEAAHAQGGEWGPLTRGHPATGALGC